MRYPKLFSPLKIRSLELKNRVVMPAMGTKFANTDRTVSRQLIDYHVARAKGGCGLNIVEVASVHALSAPRKFVAIYDDSFIPGLKELTDAIHAAGGKASIQLWQGGLAAGFDEACQIILPSDMPVSETITIPAATKETVEEVIACFGAAAKRAAAAGFDSVEIHGAHNYMIHSFLSPYFNHRTDEYGGSAENRARFPLAVIRAVRENLPADMPVFMRIGAHDDFLEGGLSIEDVITFCKQAGEAGVDVLDVSRGNIVSAGIQFEVPPIDLPRGFNVENAARIRKETGMLTMGVGRINDPDQAEGYLEADKLDLIGMGRAQLADPDFCNKAQEGDPDAITRCIGCNQGCYDGFANKASPHITCLMNPSVGREAEYALHRAASPKTVLVAGGGPAGLEAAIILKQRGHKPILCEQSDRLGGQFLLAGEAPRKQEMKEAAIHMGREVEKLGVDVRLKTPVTPALIEELKPDAVFCAIGAVPIVLNVPGGELPNVCDSHDVLDGRTTPSGRVVVIGGGLVGLEVAEFLQGSGATVTILEMLGEVGGDLGDIRKATVMGNIYGEGINVVTGASCTGITGTAVQIDRDGAPDELPCDWAVVAVGAKSRDSKDLEAACRRLSIPWFLLGDAAKARRALNATAEAARFARTFDAPEVAACALHTKKVLLLTGATGSMGTEAMKQILSRTDHFRLRVLVRPSAKNTARMKDHLSNPDLEIVWGDMTSWNDVLRAVTGADYVLHVGAFISPQADKFPKESILVNYGSTCKIIDAIKAQPNADEMKLIYIGTVAETGDRMPPIHWGRCGDPIKGSIFDYYAVGKIAAERAVIESGLKYWVSLRQTGIMPPNPASGQEPIGMHQPLRNELEWVTNIESGILCANVCEEFVPEEFWRRIYNIGGGKSFRLSTVRYYNDNFAPLGFTIQQVFEPWWFARRNFHGQWYLDSDLLNDILRFRVMSYEQYQGGYCAEMAEMLKSPMAKAMLPTAEQMLGQNGQIARKEMGTLWMRENNKEDWMNAFYGGRAHADAMPRSWDEVDLSPPGEEVLHIDHGYDEGKDFAKLDASDMKAAAEFRGGQCLSATAGGPYEKLRWRCAFGHEFEASPMLVLKGGHWCPECERAAWNYGEIAARNPFFNQVWAPLHGPEETYVIPKEVNDLNYQKDY